MGIVLLIGTAIIVAVIVLELLERERDRAL